MQKKSPLNSASVSPRALAILLVCAAAYLIVTRTLPAFLRSEAPANLSQRTLSFAERVAYQRAIEDVYWRNRIWPKERPDPKPSLDAVMTQAQLEKKVSDYLRKSQALEDYWQRPITAEQLQAEMDRMAKHTKQPEILRELFDALGNDPYVIAECLARPALADRLLTNWYAYDQRIHGELKQRAEADLQAHPTMEQMKQFSGKYSEIELVRSHSDQEEGNRGAGHNVKLSSSQWEQNLQTLAARFGDGHPVAAGVPPAQPTRLPPQKADRADSPAKGASITQVKTGVVSSLQEDPERYYATAVLSKSHDHLKLATVSWLKEPLQSWLAKAEKQVATSIEVPSANYGLPKISDGGGCIDNTWIATAGAPSRRDYHTAVWTGSEMIVWGGLGAGIGFNTGGRYDPRTDTWTPTSIANAPSERNEHTAVWTGNEMIVWGGINIDGTEYFDTGAKYNPGTNTWTSTAINNAPSGRYRHTAVWTGSEMIVWGGVDQSINFLNTGGRYNPGYEYLDRDEHDERARWSSRTHGNLERW